MKHIKIVSVRDVKLPNGQTFKAFKAVGKDGKLLDCRFVKECKNIPTKPCFINVIDENANVDIRREYPVLWIKDVDSIEEFAQKSNIDDYI